MAIRTAVSGLSCGFIGGILGFLTAWGTISSNASDAGSVPPAYRATAYELVDSDGKVVGRWGRIVSME